MRTNGFCRIGVAGFTMDPKSSNEIFHTRLRFFCIEANGSIATSWFLLLSLPRCGQNGFSFLGVIPPGFCILPLYKASDRDLGS